MAATGKDRFAGLRFDPYEDTLISTFSLAFGFALGWRAREPEKEGAGQAEDPQATVTSVQGTPFDTSMGDVLSTIRNRGVLIEFKRTFGGAKTEEKKEAKYDAILTIPERWKETAQQAHWFAARGYQARRDGLREIRFLPYPLLPELLAEVKAARRMYMVDHSLPLQCFLDSFLNPPGNIRVGVELENFQEYLAWLRTRAGTDSGDDYSGLVLVCDRDGRPHLIEFRSLNQLVQRVNQASHTARRGGLTIEAAEDERVREQASIDGLSAASTTAGTRAKKQTGS